MRRKEAGFIAAQAAIFVGVIALVALPVQSINEQQVTTSSAATGSLAFSSGVSPQGLQLEVTLDSRSVQSHGAISARVDVVNTLDRNVTLSGLAQNQNISDWNGDDYLCGNPTSSILGFALFQGHFAAGNVSSAGQPLQLPPPEVIFCGIYSPAMAVTFLPDGDQAVATNDFGSYRVTASVNATTGYCTEKLLAGSGGEVNCGASPGLVGYWNDSIPSQGDVNFTSPAFAYFPPGEYTVVATDLWGQYVYAPFVVEPSVQTNTFSSGVLPDGLQLDLTLNATTMPSGGAISGRVAIVNTLYQNVTVSYFGPSENVSAWSGYTTVCPTGYFLGYAVFAGHFTAGNISSAGTPLWMVPSDTGIICPPPEYLPPNDQSSSQITFLPGTAQTRANETFNIETGGGSFESQSIAAPNQLNVTTVFPNTQDSRYSIACGCAEPGLVGYYQDVGSGIFFPFSRGEYTIVAWDAWNQYAYAKFVVQPPP